MQRRSDRSELIDRFLSQVKVLTNVTQNEFEASLAEFKPTFVYIGSGASFEGQDAMQGSLLPFSFKGDQLRPLICGILHASTPCSCRWTRGKWSP